MAEGASLQSDAPRYDHEANKWVPQCPYGDVCSGCDAAGKCTRASLFEAVVKVNRADDPRRRARDIEEGISYACALLMDEYGYPVTAIMDIAERISDEASDRE